jgi:hypothetical protein
VIVGLPNFFVEDDVTARWSECRFDGASEFLDAAKERVARRFVK